MGLNAAPASTVQVISDADKEALQKLLDEGHTVSTPPLARLGGVLLPCAALCIPWRRLRVRLGRSLVDSLHTRPPRDPRVA